MALDYGDADRVVNLGALRRIRTETETEIAALKRQLRAPWTEPMAAVQRTLHSLKRRATSLYALRALCRGKLHVRTVDNPRAYNRELARAALDRFGLHTPAPTAIGGAS